jgi:hypothetical protein
MLLQRQCVLYQIGIFLLALLGVVPLLAAQNETITIESRSRGGSYPLGDRAFLHSKIDGEPYDLECVLSHADCVWLSPGQYEIARLILDEGSYKNCSNVDIYRLGANRLKEKPLGEYCLDYMQDYSYKNLPQRLVLLSGSVVNDLGAGVQHATVILYQWNTEVSPPFAEKIAKFETDGMGEFSGRVPLGKYDLFVLSSFTVPLARRITVTPEPQRISVRLTRDPDMPREACCETGVPTVNVNPEH